MVPPGPPGPGGGGARQGDGEAIIVIGVSGEGGDGLPRGEHHLPLLLTTTVAHLPPTPPAHPGARGPLRKLGQKLKRGSQIEPYRLFHSFNGLPFTILIHFRSDKARRKPFGGPFLVLVSNFLKILVWNPIALASGCIDLDHKSEGQCVLV